VSSLLDGPKFASSIRHDMERFMNRLATIPIIVHSDPFKVFLAHQERFEDVMKQMDQKLSSRTTETLLSMYKDLFQQQEEFALSVTAELEIGNWTEFLKLCEEKLTSAADTAAKLEEAVQDHVTNLTKLHPLSQQIFQMEKEYKNLPGVPRLDTSGYLEEWAGVSKDQQVAHGLYLSNAFKYDVSDIQAFLELLRARADVAKDAKKAVERAKKWKLTEATTEKLKKERESDLKREESAVAYSDAFTKLILAQQATVFWKEKTLNFKKSIAKFADVQVKASKTMLDTFQKLSDQCNAP